MVDRNNARESMTELLHKERYTPEELSDLTGIGLYVIRSAIHEGDLPAFVVDHDIISVSRADALDWLNRREGRQSEA